MKNLLIFLFIVLGGYQLMIAQSGTKVSFNGKEVEPGSMQHQILCLQQGDKFSIQYTPANPDEESQYVIGGLEFWAQVSMGQPKVIGRLGFSEPAAQPVMTFTLEDFKATQMLPDQTDAIRVNVRVAQVLKVRGKRMLGFEPLDEKKRSCSFMLIKSCQ
ncbi:MAG: hypothetical protein AAFR87_18375 [Bacteroidota bacterium]